MPSHRTFKQLANRPKFLGQWLRMRFYFKTWIEGAEPFILTTTAYTPKAAMENILRGIGGSWIKQIKLISHHLITEPTPKAITKLKTPVYFPDQEQTPRLREPPAPRPNGKKRGRKDVPNYTRNEAGEFVIDDKSNNG